MSEQPRDGALLAVDDLVAGYEPEVDILNGVDLTVREGQIVTVIGPNGAGKSTLIKSVFGLLPPRQGRVTLRGEDLTGLPPHLITRRGMSYVPQLDNIFPSLTVEENLEMGALERGTARERIEAIYEIFPRLGERSRQTAGTMSGGERQMLLDEPSAGLAPAFVEAIFEKVEDINRRGVTIVMVEQNARRALGMSDRGYVLDLGRNRFEGGGSDLLHDPKVADLYLGGTARLDRADTSQGERD
jgi:neutral amino acid transport system ATP-binding protein